MAATGAKAVPVIVGAGQVAHRDDEPVTAGRLVERAVRLAVGDSAGIGLDDVDALLMPPTTFAGAGLTPEGLASSLGLGPGVREQSSFSGASPVQLLERAIGLVRAGTARVVVVCGGVADASLARSVARKHDALGGTPRPWWRTFADGGGERDADPPRREPARAPSSAEEAAGVRAPVTAFALVESMFAAEAGRSFAEQRRYAASVLAPFTEVAARRADLAWFAQARCADELGEVRPDNRLVQQPYTKRMTAFPMVDLAAALVVTSETHADACRVPRARRVYPVGVATASEAHLPSARAALHRPAALDHAVAGAFEQAGATVDEVGRFDLYSCFPAAVQMGARAFGISPHDARGLTVTGGLPYFGGPGATYSTHALACMVDECRAAPDTLGAVLALGGFFGDFGVALLSADADRAAGAADRTPSVHARPAAGAPVRVDLDREGRAHVLAMTVGLDREGRATGAPLIAEFADGARTGARPASAALADDLRDTNLVGATVRIVRRDDAVTYEPA